jgi:hypothetical protein
MIRLVNNWKSGGSMRSWVKLRHYIHICLQGVSKTTKRLSEGSGERSEFRATAVLTMPLVVA